MLILSRLGNSAICLEGMKGITHGCAPWAGLVVSGIDSHMIVPLAFEARQPDRKHLPGTLIYWESAKVDPLPLISLYCASQGIRHKGTAEQGWHIAVN